MSVQSFRVHNKQTTSFHSWNARKQTVSETNGVPSRKGYEVESCPVLTWQHWRSAGVVMAAWCLVLSHGHISPSQWASERVGGYTYVYSFTGCLTTYILSACFLQYTYRLYTSSTHPHTTLHIVSIHISPTHLYTTYFYTTQLHTMQFHSLH